VGDALIQKCRSCGADIVWAVTPSGARQPLDAKPDKRIALEMSDDGAPPLARIVNTYTPHHATCPDAERWRKRRGKDG
jgi:hypothetical protein